MEAWAAYHVDAGAERVFMFLDDPHDVVAETLYAHPKVTAIVCDQKYWSARKEGRPADHRRRQTYNAEIAARRLCTSEWIAHIDTDEFLFARNGRKIADLLGTVPADHDAVRFLPAERMFVDRYVDGVLSFDGVFKLKPSTWNTFGREFYGPELGRLFLNGFQGHVEGKSFRRTRRRDLHFNIHFVRKGGEDITHHVIEPSEGVLLHYFPASFEDWKRKFERRIFDPAYFESMSPKAREQYSSYRTAQEAGGEEDLRRLFERLSVITSDRARQLIDQGCAIRPDLGLEQRALSVFKPLRPGRFTSVKRGGRRPPDQRIFLIGMNRSGAQEICQIFGAHGFSYAHWDKGNLARAMLKAKQEGARPLAAYDRINLLAGISVNSNELCYDGSHDVAYLAEHYPGAVYVLNHRPMDEWIASRARFRGGAHLEEQRIYFALRSKDDVKAKWRDDWEAHVKNVRHLQANGLHVLEWKINTEKPHLFFAGLEGVLADRSA